MPIPDFPVCDTPHKIAHIAENPLPFAEPFPKFAAPATCIEPQQLARQEQVSGTYDQTEATEHFLLAWDASNPDADAAAIALTADALETAWDVLINQNGWLPPDQTDTCLVTVVVANLEGSSSGTGGWTNVNAERGVPFMVINTDWYKDGDPWAQTLLAHEFTHASQFAYNVFWDEQDWWYWESTAEWSIELPYPEANTWTYSLWSYLAAPYLALDSDTGYVNYGHFALNVYFQENLAEDAPLQIWEAATPATDVAGAFSAAFGEDLTAHLPAYTSRVAAMDVGDRQVWLDTLVEFEVDPYLNHVDRYPAQGEVTGGKAPQGRGQNFLHFTNVSDDGLVFTFTGVPKVGSVETNWAVTVATADEAGLFTHSEVLADAQGNATIGISGEGTGEAWIGVTPLNDIGEKGASWSWQAKSAKGGDGLQRGEDPGVACGCSGVDPSGGVAAASLAVVALARRRGRSS